VFSRPERVEPGPGQESVWDYPRPPRLEAVPDRLRVIFAGQVIADTRDGFRVLETSHPPVYYFPPADLRQDLLAADLARSFCEFKGAARYWTIDAHGQRSEKAAWSYPEPSERFRPIKDYLAFYASRVDACFVGDEQVVAQAGDFYGGWVTSRVVGPFKGGPGSMGW
jgi:uncharacterized protein (DUF427 family)